MGHDGQNSAPVFIFFFSSFLDFWIFKGAGDRLAIKINFRRLAWP